VFRINRRRKRLIRYIERRMMKHVVARDIPRLSSRANSRHDESSLLMSQGSLSRSDMTEILVRIARIRSPCPKTMPITEGIPLQGPEETWSKGLSMAPAGDRTSVVIGVNSSSALLVCRSTEIPFKACTWHAIFRQLLAANCCSQRYERGVSRASSRFG